MGLLREWALGSDPMNGWGMERFWGTSGGTPASPIVRTRTKDLMSDCSVRQSVGRSVNLSVGLRLFRRSVGSSFGLSVSRLTDRRGGGMGDDAVERVGARGQGAVCDGGGRAGGGGDAEGDPVARRRLSVATCLGPSLILESPSKSRSPGSCPRRPETSPRFV